MGACAFSVDRTGKTMDEAFAAAVADAQYENGHGGSGTIAEKSEFVRIAVPKGVEVDTFVSWIEDYDEPEARERVPEQYRRLVERAHAIYDDKWGPAVGIEVKPGRFMFLGWASS
jgi:hypothetical protein